jgi:hypothetical protein
MTIWLPRAASPLLRARLLSRPPRPAPLLLRRLQSTNSQPLSPDPKQHLPDTVKAPLGARVWKKVKHEVRHYWHGTKLLVSEVRISSKLQWKILQGESLTRRERRQVYTVSSCVLFMTHSYPVEAHYAGSVATHPLLRLYYRSVHGASFTCRSQTFSQHASFDIRG